MTRSARIPAPAVAARRAAALLVDRLHLTPPVDVAQLLRDRGIEIVEVDGWPTSSVDAIIDDLAAPRTILHPPVRHRRRFRFTLGHELGHCLLGWHLGNVGCKTGEGVLDLPAYSQEDQADVFSSCVLVPDNWLVDRWSASEGDMNAMLGELACADISLAASLRAMRRVLEVGWVLATDTSTISSSGTIVPTDPSHSNLIDGASAHGKTTLHGRRVYWYRLFEPGQLPPPDSDLRTTTGLLRDAIAAAQTPPEIATWLEQSVNGTVGGSLRERAGWPALGLYQELLNRCNDQPEYGRLMRQPDFTTYLARKARDVADGRTRGKRST